MLIIGDLHGAWADLARRLREGAFDEPHLLQVGDFGVGRLSPRGEALLLRQLDRALAQAGCTLHVVRGNRDDPAYFDGRHDLPHIRFVPDYSTLDVPGGPVLCAGGAISADRAARRRTGAPWWPGEGFRPAPAPVIGRPRVVVTHAAPDFCSRLDDGEAPAPVGDPNVAAELAAECRALTELFDRLDQRSLRTWVHGHYHRSSRSLRAGVAFIGLDEGEVVRLDSDGRPVGNPPPSTGAGRLAGPVGGVVEFGGDDRLRG